VAVARRACCDGVERDRGVAIASGASIALAQHFSNAARDVSA
jgi:hypothetical protein